MRLVLVAVLSSVFALGTGRGGSGGNDSPPPAEQGGNVPSSGSGAPSAPLPFQATLQGPALSLVSVPATVSFSVGVTRLNGFQGGVQVDVVGNLPGVRVDPVTIDSGQTQASLSFVTTELTPYGQQAVDIRFAANGTEQRAHLTVTITHGQGTWDTSFGNQGIVDVTVDPAFQAAAMALQADGKYVVAGTTTATNQDVEVIRFNPDGTLDTSFGTNGLTRIDVCRGDDVAKAVAVQPDGKIVVAGDTETVCSGTDRHGGMVLRLNPDGSKDTSFPATWVSSGDGPMHLNALRLATDGSILMAGDFQGSGAKEFLVWKVDEYGRYDSSFGQALGTVTISFPYSDYLDRNASASDLVLLPTGDIVVAGTARYTDSYTNDSVMALAELSTTGSLNWHHMPWYNSSDEGLSARFVLPDSRGGFELVGSEGPCLADVQVDGVGDALSPFSPTLCVSGTSLSVAADATRAGKTLGTLSLSDGNQEVFVQTTTGYSTYTFNSSSASVVDAVESPDGSTVALGNRAVPGQSATHAFLTRFWP